MSTKDLFNRKYLPNKNEKDAFDEIESSKNLKTVRTKQDTFLPQVDYTNPAAFAKFGSARLYYESAISRILNFYPYDGSDAEINNFYNKSLDIEKYIFNSRYPRTNGYAVFSPTAWGTATSRNGGYGSPSTNEYITFKAGPNSISQTDSAKKLVPDDASSKFQYSNIYDDNLYVNNGLPSDYGSGSRTSNLKSNFDTGVTVEFWAKTGSLATSLTEKQVIADIWNNELSSSAHYGRITVELDGTAGAATPWRVTVESGSTSIFQQAVGDELSIDTLNDWKHYGFVLQNSGSDFHIKLYVNGQLNNTRIVSSTTVGELNPENLMGRIGALQTAPKGLEDVSKITNYSGAGKLSGSLDEFRFWKVARNAKQIGQNWFTQIRGGVNTDISNTTLGMYYKFNEGITSDSTVDSVVLDYGGRICNGVWTGYTAPSRNTGSAIVSASAANFEYLDPIIHSNHPDIISLQSELRDLGTNHDSQNNAMFLKNVPSWVLEEAETVSDQTSSDLERLTHIMGAYFDKLYLQIQAVPKFRHATYTSSSSEPVPFAQHLPQSLGLGTPELFIDADILELIGNRTDTTLFEEDLYQTRNLIYKNIYNNLASIFKSKGTERSIRNVLRCFNVDDNLIYVSAYSNNQLFEIQDNLKQTQKKRRLLNLNKNTSTTAVVYQAPEPGNVESRGFISGSEALAYEDKYGFTAEVGVRFPKFVKLLDEVDRDVITTVSLFGMHSASVDVPTDTTIFASDNANFQVQAIRDSQYSKNVFFRLSSSVTPFPIPLLTTSLYYNVYDDEDWNLSVAIRPPVYPYSSITSGSEHHPYDVVFRGYNNKLGTVNNSFELSASISRTTAQNFIRAAKRLYVGATNENITGSNNTFRSDVLYTDTRYWTKFLESYTLKQHSVDRENFGISGSYRNIDAISEPVNNQNSYNFNSLALNWYYQSITGSDTSGEFYVTDLSSGSALIRDNFGWAGQLAGYAHTARGKGFAASETDTTINKIVNEFKFVEPEQAIGSDMVKILSEDDQLVGTFDQVPNYVFLVEKSLYRAVSEEILDFFAGSIDFNNLIGDPVNRYRMEYKGLNYLRNIFFQRIDDVATVERYVDYYKWFDDSIATIIGQLVPASAEFINDVYNTVESHVLERNKYQSRFPTIEFKQKDPEASIRGIVETKLRYEADLFGGVEEPPTDLNGTRPTDLHVNFWEKRSLPGSAADPEHTSDSAALDTKRRTIRQVKWSRNEFSASMPVLTQINGSTYTLNRLLETQKAGTFDFTGPENFTINRVIKGGVNFETAKDIHYTYTSLYPAGPVYAPPGGVFVPQNVLFAETEEFNDVETDAAFQQKEIENVGKKRKRHLKVTQGRDFTDGLGYTVNKNSFAFPFNVISASIIGGVDDMIRLRTDRNITITNLHNDSYGPDMEIPMQGPFTNYAVGGHQSRHVTLNSESADRYYNRPEAWKLLLGKRDPSDPSCDGTSAPGAIGMTAPDYPWPEANATDVLPYPMTASQKAVYYRDFIAKRPVNIRNIQLKTGSTILGNYQNNYEVVHTFGAFENPRQFIENQPQLPPVMFELSSTSSTQGRTYLDARRLQGVPAGNDRFTGVPLSVGPGHYESIPNYNTSYLSGTRNRSVIVSRFSAIGGLLTEGDGYRDFRSNEFSVYNNPDYTNIMVTRPSQVSTGQISEPTGAGTPGIRVSDIHGLDFGLTAHASRHTARFGRDSNLVTNPGATYDQLPGFHKIHRNNKDCVRIATDTPTPVFSGLTFQNTQGVMITGSTNNNPTFAITASVDSGTGQPQTKVPLLLNAISGGAGNGLSWTGHIKFHYKENEEIEKSETIWAIGACSGEQPLAKLQKVHINASPNRPEIHFTIRGQNGGGTAKNVRWKWQFPFASHDLSGTFNHFALIWNSIDAGSLDDSGNNATLYFNGVSQSFSGFEFPDGGGVPVTYRPSTATLSNFRAFSTYKVFGQSFMNIGGGFTNSQHPLSASLDEFTFWTTSLNSEGVNEIYNGGVPCDVTSSTVYANSASSLWDWISFENKGNPNKNLMAIDASNPGTFNSSTNSLIGYLSNKFLPLSVNGQAMAMLADPNVPAGCSPVFQRFNSVTTFATHSMFDNLNIYHQIPRMSKQYAWLTASLVSDNDICGFYRPDFTRRLLSADGTITYPDSFDFVTASQAGSTVDNAGLRFIGEENEVIGNNILLQTERLNLNVIEKIDSASNTMTYPVLTSDYPVFTNELRSFINWRRTGATVPAGGLIATGPGATVEIGFTGLPSTTKPNNTITLISTDGQSVEYSADVSENLVANTFFANGSVAQLLTSLKNVIENGHSGKIIPTITGASTIRLTQAEAGQAGNTVITSTLTNTAFNPSARFTANPGLFKNQDASAFNQLMFKRGNQFGYPSWKQLRQQDHPVIINERLNNKLTVYDTDSLKEFDLRPVSMVGKPSFANFTFNTTFSSSEGGVVNQPQNATFKTSYSNEYTLFNDQDLNEIVGVDFNQQVTPYEQLISLKDRNNIQLNWALYQENLFPSIRNEFASASTTRVGYNSRFWRNNQEQRVSGGVGVRNSYGVLQSRRDVDTTQGKLSFLTQSIWPLDAPLDFETRTGPAIAVQHTASSLLVSNSAGEFQNTYSSYAIANPTAVGITGVALYSSGFNAVRAAALYARKHFLNSPRSLSTPGSIDPIDRNTTFGLPAGAEFTPHAFAAAAIQTGSGEAKWEAGDNAGIVLSPVITPNLLTNNPPVFSPAPSEPFYDNYNDFRADVKTVAKGYNIVPEFRISEHVENYTRFGILGHKDTFEIPGTDIESSQNDFYKDYSNSDFLENFLDVRQMTNLDAKEIKLTCHASIKFHPYKGFYPAQRAQDLVSQFSSSYSNTLQAVFNGIPQPQTLFDSVGINLFSTELGNIATKPLFAPGILFNSIKSGLAVDYPVVTNVENISVKHITASSADGNGFRAENYLFGAPDNKAGRGIATRYRTGSYFDVRLPFETIIDPSKTMKGITLTAFEPHPSQSIGLSNNTSASIGNGPADQLYTLMASNYFAEIGKFFLRNNEYTKLQSDGVTLSNFQFEAGETYGARLRLRTSFTGSRTYNRESGSTGDNTFFGIYGARSLGITSSQAVPGCFEFDASNISLSGTYELPQNPFKNEDFKQDFIMYSRPSAFGPAITGRLYTGSAGGVFGGASTVGKFNTSALTASKHGVADSVNGFNWAYTPPYYNGEAWVDFIFRPTGSVDYDLQRILNETQVVTRRFDPGESFNKGTNDVVAIESVGENTLVLGKPEEVDPNTALTFAPYSGHNIDANAMQMDASINLFGIENIPKKRFDKFGKLVTDENDIAAQRWVIQPKFETPMMNFSDTGVNPISAENNTLTLPTFGSASVPRGMWHQFGVMPENSEKGIFLEIGDIPETWLANHYQVIGTSSVYNNFNGVDAVNTFRKYKSFSDLMGFTNENSRVRLGEVSEKRVIREAVVAVPYISAATKQFISIPKYRFDAALEVATDSAIGNSLDAAGSSIRNQINKMKQFVLPPQFDFINNTTIDPIVMYIFDFKYELDKNDLSYIWQNTAPRNSRRVDLAQDAVAHELVNTELLTEQNLFDNDQLRWMVFKVKQRSQAKYDDVVTKQVSQPIKLINAAPIGSTNAPEISGIQVEGTENYNISYNWPYDYVSIIETVKIDTGILFKDRDPVEVDVSNRSAAQATPAPGVVEGKVVTGKTELIKTPSPNPASTAGVVNQTLDKELRKARYANPTAKKGSANTVKAKDAGPGPDFDLDKTR